MLGMFKDPKKVSAIIISRMGKSEKPESYERENGNAEKSETDFDMLADQMINCMENKDSGGLSACFKSLFLNIESRLKEKEEMPETEEE
jgi:hypothetical protein